MRASLLLLTFVALACEEPPGPPDREPPIIAVLSPTAQSHDANGDGLIDVILQWEAGEVDVESVRVRALDGVAGTAEGPVDLIDRWEVIRLDAVGLHLRETFVDLIHEGNVRLELSAEDAAGNSWNQVVSIMLPAMESHRTIALGANFLPYDLAHCDDGRIYISWYDVIVLDDSTFEQVNRVDLDAARIRCPPGQPYLLFSGEYAGRFHRETLEVQSRLSASGGIAWTDMTPELMYTGTESSAGAAIVIHQIDPLVYQRIIEIPPQISGSELVTALAISRYGRKYFASRVLEGVRVVDFDSEQADDLLTIQGYPFLSYDLRTGTDDRHLYAAVTSSALGSGLAYFQTRFDTAQYFFETNGRAIRLAVSPSGERVFLTTQSQSSSVISDNYLFHVGQAPRVLARFPRTNETGDTRLDSAVGFRSDGRLLYNAYVFYNQGSHDAFMDVYLNREPRPADIPQ